MIKVYYRGSCGSSRRACSWFKKYNLDIEKCPISQITRHDLLKLLQLSDNGFKDIVKRISKSHSEVKEALTYMDLLSFNEAIDFLLTHPYLLQSPIIIEGPNHLVGYKEDEIRKFLPKKYRRYHLQHNTRL